MPVIQANPLLHEKVKQGIIFHSIIGDYQS